METDDGFLLPRLQPEISGHPTVVLIHSPIALPPVVKLARGNAQPRNESAGTDLGLLRPAPDKIHHLIPHIVRYPDRGQSSPRLFFNAMCSAINSARTSSLVCTFFSKNSIRFCFSSAWRRGRSGVWKWPLRSRRTLFANGKIPSAAGPVLHTDPKLSPCPKGVASEPQPSLQQCSACALFLIRSLRYLNGRTLPPFPTEAGQGAYRENAPAFVKDYGKALTFVNVIYQITELFVFMKRYYERVAPEASIHVSIELNDIKDRALVATQDALGFFDAAYVSRESKLVIKKDYTVTELRASAEELAIKVPKDF